MALKPLKHYRLKLNSVDKIEELLQELYNEVCQNIEAIQKEMNKLSNSIELNNEIVDSKAKYAKAMNDFIANKDKAIGRKLEIAKLETQLDKFIVESNNNVERFKSAMPVLDGQLNRISGQIDRIIDALIETTTTSLDKKDLKRYSLLLEMLTSVKDSFNSILTKILTL